MVIRALNRKIKRLEFKIKYKKYKFAENSFLPFIEFEAQDCKNVIVDRSVSFRQGCALRVRSSGILEIGEGTAFNNNCIITCREKIKIGRHVLFGPNVAIFDHDHDFRGNDFEHEFVTDEIDIGNNVWIGANVTILKGTKIGDNAVIGANAVVFGNIPENAIYINEVKNKLTLYK